MPRAGEADAEDGQPVLTDFAEWLSRLREGRLPAKALATEGRATAIRIEGVRNETSDALVAGDWRTRKCFISGDSGDLICARDGGGAAGEMVTLFSLAFRGHPISTVGTTVNRMLRRFVAKGRDIGRFTRQALYDIEMWINHYPRRILDFMTPHELFDEQLKAIA